jgi:hypothetical protein
MAGGQYEVMTGHRPPGVPPWPRQMYIDGAAASVDALSASAEAQRASGDMTRLQETETWLALAREDLAAAVAGVDAEQLAAMGADSVMTGPAPCCGYPEADLEAGQ